MRPIWTGAISFGLVSIPVKLISGTVESKPSLHMIRKSDGCPIQYKRVCRADGKEVPQEQIVKGYEWKNGDYVILEPEDFERANPKKTHTIEIEQFVKIDEINTMFFEKPYYLVPEKAGIKAYALLREALKETKTVGVGEFVLRDKEALAIIKPYKDVILLEKLRYEEDIRDASKLSLPKSDLINSQELKEGVKLIKAMLSKFEPDQYHDNFVDRLNELIDSKLKGKRKTHKKPVAKEKSSDKIVDIMTLIKESLKNKAS
jgi:DNA end-binding protein Ku